MIRVLIYFAVLVVLALGTVWLADHPGTVLVSFGGREYQSSTLTALIILLVAAVVVAIAWALLSFIFRVPSVLSMASRTRRRERGMAALSRGMLAIGAGDKDAASRYAYEADRYLEERADGLAAARSDRAAGRRPRGCREDLRRDAGAQ